jgi:hypothetical protein
VTVADTTPTGLRAVVEDREAVPGLTAALTAVGVAVYGVTPRPPTLEDVYFAIEQRAALDPGRAA